MQLEHFIDLDDPKTHTVTRIDPTMIDRVDVTEQNNTIAVAFKGRAAGVMFLVPDEHMEAAIEQVEAWYETAPKE